MFAKFKIEKSHYSTITMQRMPQWHKLDSKAAGERSNESEITPTEKSEMRKSNLKVSFIFLVSRGRSSKTNLTQNEITVCIAKLIAPSYSRSLAHKNKKKEIR